MPFQIGDWIQIKSFDPTRKWVNLEQINNHEDMNRARRYLMQLPESYRVVRGTDIVLLGGGW